MESYNVMYAIFLANNLTKSLDNDIEDILEKPIIDNISLIELYNKIKLNNKINIISKKKNYNKKVYFNDIIEINNIKLELACSYGYNYNTNCIFCDNKFPAVGKLVIKPPYKQYDYKLSYCLRALLYEFNKNSNNYYTNIIYY